MYILLILVALLVIVMLFFYIYKRRVRDRTKRKIENLMKKYPPSDTAAKFWGNMARDQYIDRHIDKK